ncbi:MAG TPA: DUF3943 domain-containing protein [Candidatus Polarisedimenticolia bacterium]|jgi:hypothetical protein|nr:DUF3943 domain-containing protein [Candidatus Polarisedimenticolia bacterium]
MTARNAPDRARRRAGFLGTILLAASFAALAEEGGSPDPVVQAAEQEAANSGHPDTAESPPRRSFLVPAADIVAFDLLLNLVNRRVDGSDYDSSWETIRRNARGPWVVDDDPFAINQLWHPYQGAAYQGFARSAGLGFWQSFAYTFAGSVLWEIAGEATPPSRNDQIASGIGGNFLGEPLFRMAAMVLGNGDTKPGFWRQLVAAGISPSTGFNRLAFGDRFDSIFDDGEPAYFSRLQIGASGTAQNDPGTSTRLRRNEGLVDFSLDYGLPGKSDDSLKRPFDYFSFQITVSSGGGFESVLTRGILVGADYEAGRRVRGLWGLYGAYDYIAPQTFRVSSTALGLGTTAQWSITDSTALQGTALLGAGYGAVGTINGADENDYHYGIAPVALTALRANFGDRSSIDVTARDYFVSRVAAADTGGHDNIVRADASFTMRLRRKHAISIKYLWNHRAASYPDLGDRTQTRATVGLFYTRLGHDRFGTVDWSGEAGSSP